MSKHDADAQCPSVLIGDRDPLVRMVLRRILESDGIAVSGDAATTEDLERLAAQTQPDAVVLDVALPGDALVDLIGRLAASAPRPVVVTLSTRADDDLALRLLRAGAAGFLTKDRAVEALPRAIRAAVAGEPVVARRLVTSMIEHLRGAPMDGVGLRPVRSVLTPREWEVLDLLCLGRTIDEIADELVLSTETIRSHVKHLFRKTGSHTRREVVEKAAVLRAPAAHANGHPPYVNGNVVPGGRRPGRRPAGGRIPPDGEEAA